ncbi:FAD-dependent oxidoreductase [Desulfopila sp. IMCC35008]|uniref:FAD-dependent oxidoreductase n=1 Tax=Desulfopila sp. IMCC35008 TaxID=2653858 RepID=UPI0013D8518D|nr:FAD-dependent oxidoreductase [Desulfopila sp. IMCC35008]
MSKRIVIIGGVAAGPKTAVRAKRLMPDSDVTLVDQDSMISYGGCGIPYYVSGDVPDEKELRSTSFHMVRDATFFENAKGVKTITSTRALSIDREKKTVTVEYVKTGDKSDLEYDILMLATGSEPVRLPLPGVDLEGVYTISDLHKAIEIKDRIAKGKVGKAVVVGGGAIGLEMAEALTDLWGVETSVVEFMDQLLPSAVGWSMASMLTKHLRDNNIEVFLGEAAQEVLGEDGKVVGLKTGKRTLEADLVILAAGVRPRSQLAVEAGLQVSKNGAIVVNERMQTSDPAIYAAGDCVEIMHLVTGKRFFAPFGSLANKEGRVAANNMAGIPTVFKGAVGSFIMKAFDICIGAVGLSLEQAKAEGFDAESSYTSPSDRAHFYPGQAVMCLELVFDKRTRRVLGMEGVGPMNDGLSARIDAAAVAISDGATIDEFYNIEMCYAPPFSAAIDAINAAGYVAENICDGRMNQISPQEFCRWMDDQSLYPDWLVLDVRHTKEAAPLVEKYPEKWLSIPYDQVRARHGELTTDKTVIVVCNAGSRSYEIQLFMGTVGKENYLVLPGGLNFIRRVGADWLE